MVNNEGVLQFDNSGWPKEGDALPEVFIKFPFGFDFILDVYHQVGVWRKLSTTDVQSIRRMLDEGIRGRILSAEVK